MQGMPCGLSCSFASLSIYYLSLESACMQSLNTYSCLNVWCVQHQLDRRKDTPRPCSWLILDFSPSPFPLQLLQQLLSTYAQGEAASENLERILERMREDGLQPDLKTYNHILDL